MSEIRNALGVAVVVCVAVPMLAPIAEVLLPTVVTLFACAALFTAVVHHTRR